MTTTESTEAHVCPNCQQERPAGDFITRRYAGRKLDGSIRTRPYHAKWCSTCRDSWNQQCRPLPPERYCPLCSQPRPREEFVRYYAADGYITRRTTEHCIQCREHKLYGRQDFHSMDEYYTEQAKLRDEYEANLEASANARRVIKAAIDADPKNSPAFWQAVERYKNARAPAHVEAIERMGLPASADYGWCPNCENVRPAAEFIKVKMKRQTVRAYHLREWCLQCREKFKPNTGATK